MFECTRNGSVFVVRGDGPLSSEHLPEAKRALEECFKTGSARVVLDLRSVPLLDSAGLELLLETRDRCLRHGGALQLAAPTPLCRDILRATGVGQELEIFEDVVRALGSFSQ